MSSSLRLERQQQICFKKICSNDIFWLFLFLSCSFGVGKTNTFIRSRGSLAKQYSISDHNGQNLYPFSHQNSSKTKPFGVAHTNIADKGTPPPPLPRGDETYQGNYLFPQTGLLKSIAGFCEWYYFTYLSGG